MAIFQERLRLCRKQAGLTQEQMAAELQIVFRSYRRYESGETEPTLSSLVKMSDYFNVSLDYLAGRTEK